MPHLASRPAALLLTALLVGLSGCVKFKQVLTVQPDGSGKMHISMALSEQMLGTAGDEDPFSGFGVEELAAQEASGWIAFTQPRVYSADGFKTVEMTGYFRDINAVVFGGGLPENDAPDTEPELSTTYRMADGQLTVTGGIVAQMIGKMGTDPSLNDPATRAMMAPLMQGLEISETYVLPRSRPERRRLHHRRPHRDADRDQRRRAGR